MPAHDECAPPTRHLCELLISTLARSGFTGNHSRNWCSLGLRNGARCAFVRHSRKGLCVFLRAGESDGEQFVAMSKGRSVAVLQRHSMGSEWAKTTPYYFELRTESEVTDAERFILYAAQQLGKNGKRQSYLLPSEASAREMVEGARITVQVSRIERDPTARKKCIDLFGASCTVCGFNFGLTYGALGSGFIHVHHLRPLAATIGRRKVEPKRDLRPVCPNCHEMLHKQNPPLTVEALKALISTASIKTGMN